MAPDEDKKAGQGIIKKKLKIKHRKLLGGFENEAQHEVRAV
ncbi:MAG: hypothetical protein QXT02_05045 [Candidatus Hadarchaeum sp.]